MYRDWEEVKEETKWLFSGKALLLQIHGYEDLVEKEEEEEEEWHFYQRESRSHRKSFSNRLKILRMISGRGAAVELTGRDEASLYLFATSSWYLNSIQFHLIQTFEL